MRGAALHFTLMVLGIILGIAWLNSRLLGRWFPPYQSRWVRRGYWLITATACLTIEYLWSVRPTWFSDIGLLRTAAYAAFVWVIGQLILLLFAPFIYLLRRLTASGSRTGTVQPTAGITRRTFLRRAVAVTPLLAFGLATEGVLDTELNLTVKKFDLAVAKLPAKLAGFRIVQVSDVHLGPYFTLAKFDRLIDLVRQEKPDLLAVTGDLIDDLNLLRPAVQKLAGLSLEVPKGAYFCWGNHEYFHNIDRIRRELADTPIVLLENGSICISANEHPFYLLGVDYPWARNGQEQQAVRRQFMDQALAGVPAGAFTVLLAHHPDFLADGFAAGIPLTLSGHTHGGQVALFGYPLLPLHYVYMRGLYRAGNAIGYVNSGAGQWFPFRLGCPAEISVFNLRNQV